MKIAFFTDCYLDLTGGITTTINTQKAELERQGHTVYVFSSGFPRSIKEQKKLARQHIYAVPSFHLFIKGVTPIAHHSSSIVKWLEKNHKELKKFDVFHIHYESSCSIAGIKLAKKLNKPIVQTMHGREDVGETHIIPLFLRNLVAFGLNILHKSSIKHTVKIKKDNFLAVNFARKKMWEIMVNHANAADLVLTPSAHFREKLLYYGVKKPVRVLKNGIPDQIIDTTFPVRHLNPNEPMQIIWHSRISREKRMMAFLRTLNKVNFSYCLNAYGNGGDFHRAKRYSKRHHISATFHGNTPLSEIRQQMLKSHLDILVSYNFDTFGMTLIEAESMGLPVFFCDPDLQEVVPRAGSVMASSPKPKVMAKTLDELYKNPSKIEQMSKKMLSSRDQIRQSKYTRQLIDFYKSLLH